MCRWNKSTAITIGISIAIAIPAAFAVGSPNVNTQYGSPGVFGYDAQDLSFPNPGFPDTYGVRRDAYGALRDADMLPDNSVIGPVAGQYQDLGVRKVLPYPYNMGGYELGLGGTPHPGAWPVPYQPANGYMFSGSGYANAFKNYGRAFETAAALASTFPNGAFGRGFSGNGVYTAMGSNEYGSGSLGLASEGYAYQPANNLALAARGFVIQPGANYTVINPLSGAAMVNAGSAAAAIAGSPFANYGLTNPLAGQSAVSSPRIATAGATTNFSAVGVPLASGSGYNVRTNNARGIAIGAAVPGGLSLSGPAANFGGPNIPIAIAGQRNFDLTASTANITSQAVNGNIQRFPRNVQLSALPTTDFALTGPASNSTGISSPFSRPVQLFAPNNNLFNPVGPNDTSIVQDVNLNPPVRAFARPSQTGNPSIALTPTSDFSVTAPSNINTGVQFAVPGSSDFSPIVASTEAFRQSLNERSSPRFADGTGSALGTYGLRPNNTQPIATVSGVPYSSTAAGRIQVPNANVTVAAPFALTGPTNPTGFNPNAIAGGFGGALVPTGTTGGAEPMRRRIYARPFNTAETIAPAAPVAASAPESRYGLAQALPKSGPGTAAGHLMALVPKRSVPRVATAGTATTISTVRRSASVQSRTSLPALDRAIASAIGPITGSIVYDDGRVTILGARGVARELSDRNVVLTLNDGTVVAVGKAPETMRQLAAKAQLSL